MDGLSEATLEKFVDEGFIKDYTDLFRLEKHHDTIVTMEGFGEKSFANLLESIEKAKDVSLPNLIYSLGILNVGLANAKVICRAFDNDTQKLLSLSKEELTSVDTIGEVIADSYVSYFADEKNLSVFKELLSVLRIKAEEAVNVESELSGKTVVVTGSLNLYGSRKELQDEIEKRGAKLSGSVSKNTFVLVNNDITSNSSKNKTAKELGVPIISEADFVEKYLK